MALLVILMAIGSGVGLWWIFPGPFDRRERFCFGVVAGLVGLAWRGFGVLWLVGPGKTAWLMIGVLETVLGALAAYLVRRRCKTECDDGQGGEAVGRQRSIRPGLLVWYGGWLSLFLWLSGRIIEFGENGMTTAPATNYGDLAFHLSVISSFAYGGNIPPENPVFAGVPFTYPFLIDLLTAIPVGMGAGWRASFLAVNLPLLMALVGIVESLGRRLGGTFRAGQLALLIFFFSGGLGFLKVGGELHRLSEAEDALGGIVGLLGNLPESYTINNSLSFAGSEIALRYGNLITTLLIPQRSLLFGLPVVGMIIIMWWLGLRGEDEWGTRLKMFIGAGVLTGLLPMLHAHGFLAVILVAVPVALIHRRLEWGGYFLPATIIALPQALWLGQTGVRKTLFEALLWWEAGATNPVLFWLANAGLFPAVLGLVIAALGWRKDWRVVFYSPFLIWFVVPNLVRLAHWTWDNIKLLVYWAMVSSALVGLGVDWVLRRRAMLARALAVVLLMLLVLSGLLDVWRGLSPVEKVVLLTAEDLRVATRVRESTGARSIILHAPIHNTAVILTGRRSLMGYPGHLWSQGIDYQEREEDLKVMMLHQPEAPELLKRYGVEYVLTAENDEGYRERYPLVFTEGSTRLYRVVD